MPLTPGSRLGPYEIVATLGAGGMGEVYRARDPRLRREIALKVLPSDLAADPSHLARFEREARVVARLNHPNIVVVHSIEDAGGIRFLTMELVEGRSLDSDVVATGLPIARVVEVGIALADALAAAHAKGIVHRDLKPANIVVDRDGRVKVLDFGLARETAPDAGSTSTATVTVTRSLSGEGGIAGTVPYMAPEQLRGDQADARSDLFSLGVILYELITGRRPFVGETVADVAASILRDTPVPVQSLRRDVPREIAHVVDRCLDKDPERRVQTAKDVRNELERARPTAEPASMRPSIAILPFENRGRDQDDEYFADGITEDVIAQLCKVSTIRVISLTSVMQFKGHRGGLQDIASRLRVGHLVEGSVRRVGDRVRIVAQLVDPMTGQDLWAETYDRRLTDIFEIQTEVALQIAAALKAELTSSERDRIRKEPTRDVVAYELYLRGRQSLLRFNVEGMLEAIEYFDRAIERDPAFAPPNAGLAIACTELADHGARARDQVGPRALAAAARAATLDPELGDAHFALAYARAVFQMDWVGAEAGYRRALELSPGNAFIYDYYGRMCAALERFDEAIALQEKAYELDPLVLRADLATSLLRAGRNDDAARLAARSVQIDPNYARAHATLGWALFRQGHVREGIVELERAHELAPAENIWLAQLGEAYGLAGQTEKAREVLRRLEDSSRPEPTSPYHLAYVYTGLGDVEGAMDCLERAYESGTGSVYSIKGSFLLAPLRHHPRFTALLHKMGLA